MPTSQPSILKCPNVTPDTTAKKYEHMEYTAVTALLMSQRISSTGRPPRKLIWRRLMSFLVVSKKTTPLKKTTKASCPSARRIRTRVVA